MCGIWSYIQLVKNQAKTKKLMQNFWNIQNRGPDNSVLETFSSVVVGFHRLAIMDTTFKSNQPFHFSDGLRTVIFTCNGEIYNYKELIKKYDLEIEGDSDCMTIPQLYLKFTNEGKLSQWKYLFQREIKGEFSFILYEFDKLKNLREVFIGRDQIGIRPLYCSDLESKDEFLLSSEVKGMKDYDGVVNEFPPGHIVQLSLNEFGNINKKNYSFKWVYHVTWKNKEVQSEEYYLEKLRTAVINSVRRRLSADRPVAFLLSGGVDSSLVCAISAKILGQPINTFCCGMGEGTDLKYAKMVADHIKSNHKEVIFSVEEGLNSIPEVINATESWDTTTVRASVGQFLVSKFIGQNTDCRVVLVGEGPDEVCSSYMFNWNAPDGDSLHKAALKYVEEIHYYDCKRSDRCISHWGLEGRVPLLDPEVIEAYWSIPAEWRMPTYKGIEKWWLRKAFDGMNLLPDEVLWRKKEAFSDGVSSKEKSWYEMIQDFCQENVIEKDFQDRNNFLSNIPPTKEAFYFRYIFQQIHGVKRENIIPRFWQPMWSGVKEGEYIDPSARVLSVYEKDETNVEVVV